MRSIPAIFLICAAVCEWSCGNEPATENKTDCIPRIISVKDSLVPNDSVPLTLLAKNMGGDTITPADPAQILFAFTLDYSGNKNRALSAKEVRKRFIPLDPHCDGEAALQLKAFFRLDSLKKLGEDPDGDLGQTVFVEIRLIDTIYKTAYGSWVAWTMYYHTAEMCPYASGTYYMLTTCSKTGQPISTQCMGCDVGGADAPISWTRKHTTNIFRDGSYRGLLTDSTEDYDANDKPVYSVYRRTFTGMIDGAGKIMQEELEIERTE